MLYFDHNATSPLSSAARAAWLEATARYIGNPSSPHRIGARADAALSQAKEKLAAWLGCDPHDLVWTSGATESNNTAVQHFAQDEGEAWISAIEHPSMLGAVRRWFPNRHRLIPVNRSGVVETEWIRGRLQTARPALVAVMAANNETGVLQPWEAVSELCLAHNVPYLCDATQWVGKLPIASLGKCGAVSGCGHKFGGPAGVGFLKAPAALRPLLHGGRQEDGRRAGTENVAGILAMIAALEDRESHTQRDLIGERLSQRTDFELELRRNLPQTQIVGGGADRLWNTVSVVMPEVTDCRQRWVVKLDKLGFAVSTGSACASGKEQSSHVLEAMGFSVEAASRVLRFSSGWESRSADWRELLDGVIRAHGEMRVV